MFYVFLNLEVTPMRRRLALFVFAAAVLLTAPLALARYAICHSVYNNGCLNYRTCFHFDDSGNQTGIVWETYQCP